MNREFLRFGPFGSFWCALQPEHARKRFFYALALSFFAHALLLLLAFGATGIGLPGLVGPVAERRPPPTEVRARLAEVAPEPATAPSVPVVTLQTAPQPQQPPPSAPPRVTRTPAPAAKVRAREPKVQPKPRPPVLAQRKPQPDTFKVPPPLPPDPEPQRAPQVAAAKPVEEPPPAPEIDPAAERRKTEEAARIAAEEAAARRRTEEEAKRQAQELEARKLAEAKAREEAEELARQRLAQQTIDEAKKLEDARRIEDARRVEEKRKEEEARRVAEARKQEELKKQEDARRLAEAQRQEELKKQEEAKRVAELQRQEELKKEEARRLALEIEALRRAEELARRQAELKKESEAKRLAEEAAKRAQQEAAAKAEAEAQALKREIDRLAAQKPGAPAGPGGPVTGPPSGRELASKALEQLRTPGGREEILRAPGVPPPPIDNLRRRALVGVERDVQLRMYIDSWRWKIERNGALNYRRSASWRVYEPPIVTVSIRSDGSLEQVWIHRSSGVGEIDEAVRRIAHLHAPYSAFPPGLARQYDVLDIRRVWFFEDQLRIRDE